MTTFAVVVGVVAVFVACFKASYMLGTADARAVFPMTEAQRERIERNVMAEVERRKQLYRAFCEEYDDPYVGAEDEHLRGDCLKLADEWLDAVASEAGAVWLEAEGT